MRVLFVCNAHIENSGLTTASWIQSIIESSSEDFEYCIMSPSKKGMDSDACNLAGKRIELWPLSLESKAFSKNVNAIQPDVAIVFGTEHKYSLPVLRLLEENHFLDHTLLFSQGFSSVCAQHYTEGLPSFVSRRATFRDIIRFDSIRIQTERFKRSAKCEKEAMKLCKFFIGRTTLDRTLLWQANQQTHYFRCSDIMRNVFYSDVWKYETCQKHRIFVSQYYYPLKGFHYLLNAAAMLKDKYPDLLIAAAGYDLIGEQTTAFSYKDSSYIRYIKYLIKKYDLKNNICFTGILSAEEMKEQYLKANVFVMPSTIENSPNSMAEAMLLGVPSIAADVGGVSDYALHKREAFIYPSSADYLLAYYIDQVFSSVETAKSVSCNARERAQKEYDRVKNIARFEEILRTVRK